MPPVDHILPSEEVKPAWLAWRLGLGSTGGDAAQLPAGHAETDRVSTRLVESKNPPPVASPPIAYNDPFWYASPKSALAGVNAGPVVQVPVLMSRRRVVKLLASGDSVDLPCPLSLALLAIEVELRTSCGLGLLPKGVP